MTDPSLPPPWPPPHHPDPTPSGPEGTGAPPPAPPAPPPPFAPPPDPPVPSTWGTVPPATAAPPGSAPVGRGPSLSPGRGPRLPGRGLLGALGLLGLLLTIGIMAFLGVRILTSVTDSPESPASLTDQILPPEGPGEDTAAPGLRGVESANETTCTMTAATIATAAEAYEITYGSPPPDQQALVDTGMLRQTFPTHEIRNEGGETIVVGIGDCAP